MGMKKATCLLLSSFFSTFLFSAQIHAIWPRSFLHCRFSKPIRGEGAQRPRGMRRRGAPCSVKAIRDAGARHGEIKPQRGACRGKGRCARQVAQRRADSASARREPRARASTQRRARAGAARARAAQTRARARRAQRTPRAARAREREAPPAPRAPRLIRAATAAAATRLRAHAASAAARGS